MIDPSPYFLSITWPWHHSRLPTHMLATFVTTNIPQRQEFKLIRVWQKSGRCIPYAVHEFCNSIIISIHFTTLKSGPWCEWITNLWPWLLLLLCSLRGKFWCGRNSRAWRMSVKAIRCSLWDMHWSNRNSWATSVW